jgi:hypothetical protein
MDLDDLFAHTGYRTEKAQRAKGESAVSAFLRDFPLPKPHFSYFAVRMSDHSDAVWDEYEWERCLQQQEQRTEKYMELLEKYMDHPQRDEIIAREMNWTHLQDDTRRQWEEEVDAMFEQEAAGIEEEEEEEPPQPEEGYPFERHPLYRQALDFSAELGRILDGLDPKDQEHPAANSLQTNITIATAKLAAALSDGDEADDLGMCIAYLKRALHSINASLSSIADLETGVLSEETGGRIRGMLFLVRDGIVSKMGVCRAEFRRRHGR